MRRAVLQADDRQPPNRLVVVRAREPVELGTNRVDRPRALAREQLERDQRGASAGRALVVEATPEQLDLLTEAKLADRPVGDRALAVVGAASGALDLVVPLPAQVGELAFVSRLGEGVSLGRCLLERQDAWSPFNERGAGPTYRADGRKSLPFFFCSRMCADQPATREHANIAGASGGGISATSSTTAE